MKELLFFILGMFVGGFDMTLMMCCLHAAHINEYESKLRRLEQNNKE